MGQNPEFAQLYLLCFSFFFFASSLREYTPYLACHACDELLSNVGKFREVLGNTFTVVVFWKNRNKLKRTSFLLINLAVADLLVGLSQMITTGGIYIPHHIQTNSTLRDDVLKQQILVVPQLCQPYASMFSSLCSFRLNVH